MAKLPQDFILSGLKKGHSSVTVITGSGFDVEAGIPTFREKGFYEDKEAAYLASVDAFNSDTIRQAMVPQVICKLPLYTSCSLPQSPC